MRRLRFAGLAAALGLAAVAFAPLASATPPGCLVVDTNANQSYKTLQAAVSAATAGDTLFVKGTCTGTTTIARSLTISGQGNGGNKTATLDGGGSVGSVLTVVGGTVTLNTLTITGGSASYGGGIYNSGAVVTLNDSSVSGNTATYDGGGIYNDGGTLTLNDSSSISDNTATFGGGGGVYNVYGTLTLNDSSSISGNIPDDIYPE